MSLRLLLKLGARRPRDYAPGLPSRTEYGDLRALARLVGQMTEAGVQRHEARRAGTHFDLRLQTPEGLLSFALPAARLPEPGKKVKAIQTQLHRPEYLEFEGDIGAGYGAGRVSREWRGRVMPTRVLTDQAGAVRLIDFAMDTGGQQFERYKLVKTRGARGWLLLNTTPTRPPDYQKAQMITIGTEELEPYLEQVSGRRPMSVKIDGAHALLDLMKDKAELLSYRTSKRTGGPIIHTERVAPELRALPTAPPEDLIGRRFVGELYAETPEGAVLPVQRLSGLLNTSLARARDEITRRNLRFRMALLDVLPATLSPEEKRDLIDRAAHFLPRLLTTPPAAVDPVGARQLLEEVVAGRHPLSSEGVVFTRDGPQAKFKRELETDVVVREVYPGEGKYRDRGAGGFRYSLTPTGPILGSVGSGFDDTTRQDMLRNPGGYVGRVARVVAQDAYPSGAFRMPIFKGLHEDYPRQAGGRMEWGSDIESRLAPQ